jgi:hypothetical protein
MNKPETGPGKLQRSIINPVLIILSHQISPSFLR